VEFSCVDVLERSFVLTALFARVLDFFSATEPAFGAASFGCDVSWFCAGSSGFTTNVVSLFKVNVVSAGLVLCSQALASTATDKRKGTIFIFAGFW